LTELAPISYKIIAKFHNEIRAYLEQFYGLPELIEFDSTRIDKYRHYINKILCDTSNFKRAGFISPDGKLKRLNLDLSRFVIKDSYKDLLNLDLEKLTQEYVIEHDAVRYFGLDINDILSAGYMRIGWDKYKDQFYIQFDTRYCFPSSKVFEIIENILLEMDILYIAFGNNDDYSVFSIKNGDSIKDIKRYFNRHKHQ
jgi:hypothetical protein